MKPSFRELLQNPHSPFPIGAEIVTSRGIPLESNCPPLRLAAELVKDDRTAWISITDNPGGNPMLPPDWLAGQLAKFSQNIVLHLACKDLNRIGLESQLWRYAAEGFENVLALSGDLPLGGYPKPARGVFDMDSVALLEMIRSMNRGLVVPGRGGKLETLLPTNFFSGCAVTPFKKNENELVPQYYKLVRKIRSGAAWLLPQLGYDMRKFHEIKRFLNLQNVSIPIIGNVYVLTKTVAKIFNSGKLAGCVVTDKFLAEIEKYAAGTDKGKQYFRELAAKQLAVFHGLGFAAGYIGGLAAPESFFEILEIAKQFSQDDWKTFYKEIQHPQPDEFYFFEHDCYNCASSERDAVVHHDLDKRNRTRNVNFFYRFSRCVHALAFHRDHAFYPLIKRVFQFLDKENSFCRFGRNAIHRIEEASKHILYGCQDCGDCALPDTAYLCLCSRCSKNMRNGPCGGSFQKQCEAGDKECIWTIAYDRMKYFGEWSEFLDAPVSIYDASLKSTSSWRNLYLDRDHSAENERDNWDSHH
ncbi:MAG: methylenetetrahydrofolate reductase C-terminal domain-containing protein [Planctomycetaceae bacterium]|jgi:methylenetetrahydrofolate reductase (NADPH)|nr:methylenetetrahydrofolate reductase C-terminal domain-containing protein [Planctomycetaceae bacterium]